MQFTLKDVARKAGVSYTTVSRALNNYSDVNEKTRKRIVKIADEMGYRPNAIAQGLVKKETMSLGLIIPDIINPFFAEIARGVEDAAEKEGYNVFLCNTNYKEEREIKYINVLMQKQVDGLIISPSSGEVEILRNLSPDSKIVFINRNIHSNRTSIMLDNVSGAQMAVDHLIERGRKKIAFIGKERDVSTAQERLQGYKKALLENGIEIRNDYIICGNFKRESGYLLMKKLLKLADKPTAVVAYNDLLALGVIQAIKEENIKIPEEIAVVGFDDIEFASLPEIQLTTVAQPKYEMGINAFEILFNQIKKGSSGIGRTILIKPRLIVRKTS